MAPPVIGFNRILALASIEFSGVRIDLEPGDVVPGPHPIVSIAIFQTAREVGPEKPAGIAPAVAGKLLEGRGNDLGDFEEWDGPRADHRFLAIRLHTRAIAKKITQTMPTSMTIAVVSIGRAGEQPPEWQLHVANMENM